MFPVCREVRAPGAEAKGESANKRRRTSIWSSIRITPMSNSCKLRFGIDQFLADTRYAPFVVNCGRWRYASFSWRTLQAIWNTIHVVRSSIWLFLQTLYVFGSFPPSKLNSAPLILYSLSAALRYSSRAFSFCGNHPKALALLYRILTISPLFLVAKACLRFRTKLPKLFRISASARSFCGPFWTSAKISTTAGLTRRAFRSFWPAPFSSPWAGLSVGLLLLRPSVRRSRRRYTTMRPMRSAALKGRLYKSRRLWVKRYERWCG